jgi:hypothetical protein
MALTAEVLVALVVLVVAVHPLRQGRRVKETLVGQRLTMSQMAAVAVQEQREP